MLRKLRLLQPATAAEPALEAAAWAHRPVVRAGDASRPIAPAHQLALRQAFGRLPAGLQRAALYAALQVHAWQGRSTEVADFLAWDAHASDAAACRNNSAICQLADAHISSECQRSALRSLLTP